MCKILFVLFHIFHPLSKRKTIILYFLPLFYHSIFSIHFKISISTRQNFYFYMCYLYIYIYICLIVIPGTKWNLDEQFQWKLFSSVSNVRIHSLFQAWNSPPSLPATNHKWKSESTKMTKSPHSNLKYMTLYKMWLSVKIVTIKR